MAAGEGQRRGRQTLESMELFKRVVGPKGSTASPIIILHGLFGGQRNWQSVAQALADRLGRLIICPDLRNHGRSVRFATDGEPVGMAMSWPDLGADLDRLLQVIDRPVTLLGHSLGGHICMQYVLATDPPNRPVEQMIIVDIAPRPYEFSNSAQERYLEGMKLLHSQGLPRPEAIRLFRDRFEPNEHIVQFLFTNYGRLPAPDGRLGFLLPLQALQDGMLGLGRSFADRLGTAHTSLPTHFIKGGRSDYIDGEAASSSIAKHFINYDIAEMAEAGHWPHYDDPGHFLNLVTRLLSTTP